MMDWYEANKRDLPWRRSKDVYVIWISEIMLQQTRVEAVKDYFYRFMEKFPTVEALAAASEEELLKQWEGLGYYSRARNLHKTAKLVAGKGFPRDYEEIRALPGIGDYTAGAICSIAYNMPCPAVDGNVLRILTRLLTDSSNIDDRRTKGAFAEELRQVYPEAAGEFCQALMELGATVCVPNGAPLCTQCPWREICLAHLSGQEDNYPVRAEKKERKIVKVTVFVLHCGGKYALEKRSDKGLLAGLWQFPLKEGRVRADMYGAVVKERRTKHIFTHVEWRITGFYVETDEQYEEFTWVTAEELKTQYALPAAFKPFKEWVK